ncbi:hypothetical protein EDD18DRAFT_1203848 [Armillaria luteobubalina]|uniref:Uncharacterized protein n=1 Tax=Armillaria luteobubalina TaxID=153913 RepID=A0AA39U9H5_9AGAR|nr:hypothetical protein EDD18DRAFT_1203848 [Armillaria luteobubalina]
MNMYSHHIEDDVSAHLQENLQVDTIGVAGAIEILRSMTGSSADDLNIPYIGRTLVSVDFIRGKRITHSQQENYAPTGYGSFEATLPLIGRQTATTGAMRKVPPSDPAAFDACTVALFLQSIDTAYQHPQQLYAHQRAPHQIPPTDPAAFDAWITSFFTRSEANRTRHRDAVRDELPKSILIDTQSGSPLGSATAMASTLPPQPGLPWWIPPLVHIPKPVVATTAPEWLGNGELSVMFMSHAHVVVG